MEIFEERWADIFAVDKGTDRQNAYKKYVTDLDKEIGSFLEFDPDKGLALTEVPGLSREEDAEGSSTKAGTKSSVYSGLFSGIPFGVKDNIAVKSFKLTCGSKILKDFVSPYTATSVSKLIAAGAVVAGKTNLDEFGMGSSTDNSALKVTNNPWDHSRVAGGSSGGSAAAVAAGIVPFALGTDTGGSVRQPASFCGIYGLKPTYGVVSRYGLTAYASSLDVVGVLSKTPLQSKAVFDIIKGQDVRDNTSISHRGSENNGKVSTIGFLRIPEGALSPEVEHSYKTAIARMKSIGYSVKEIEIKTLEYVVPAYYTIATAEASANLARYTGIRYGYASEEAKTPGDLMEKSRNDGFGDEVKLRILLGTYVLRSGFQDQYYHKAQKVRTAIRNEFNVVFGDVDLVMMPVFPTPAFKHGGSELDPFQQKVADKYTCTANLTGFPAISIPSSVEKGLPVGFQLIAPPFEEERLFNAAIESDKLFPAPKNPNILMSWS